MTADDRRRARQFASEHPDTLFGRVHAELVYVEQLLDAVTTRHVLAADSDQPENKHRWLDMTRIGDLPNQTFVCGKCGKWRVMKQERSGRMTEIKRPPMNPTHISITREGRFDYVIRADGALFGPSRRFAYTWWGACRAARLMARECLAETRVVKQTFTVEEAAEL